MKNWAIPFIALSGSFVPAGRDKLIAALALFWALAVGLIFCYPAPGLEAGASSALISSVRLESITRLVQSYNPTTLPVYRCPELPINDKPAGVAPADDPALVISDSPQLKLVLRFAWEESGLHTALLAQGPPEELLSGNLARLCFAEAGVGEIKINHEYMLSAGENGLNLRPLETGAAPALTSESLSGGWQGEAIFSWPSLSPITPFSEGLLLTVQLLAPAELSPQPVQHYLLLMIPQDPGAPRGYLSLVGPAAVAGKILGDNLVSQLYLSSPAPQEAKLRLQIFRRSEDRESEVVRIAKEVRLEQGVNAFRLYWDSSRAAAGNYSLQATATADNQEIFSHRIPFSLAPGRAEGQ